MKNSTFAITLAVAITAAPAVHAATNVTAAASINDYMYGGALADDKVYSEFSMPDFSPSLSTSVAADGASAWASADLRSGSLKGYASSLNPITTVTKANFVSGMQDEFTFEVAGASEDTRTIAYLAMDFEASIVGGTSVEYSTSIGGSRNFIRFNHEVFQHSTVTPDGSFSQDVAYSTKDSASASGNFSYLLPFELLGANHSVGFESYVNGFGDQYGLVDFANSAHMRFVLPDGVAFTSGSGVSLTAPVEAVPEPSTWAMMLLGFGFVGGAMRSAKRRTKLTVSYA